MHPAECIRILFSAHLSFDVICIDFANKEVQLPGCKQWHFEWLISSLIWCISKFCRRSGRVSHKGITFIHQNFIFHQPVPLIWWYFLVLCSFLGDLFLMLQKASVFSNPYTYSIVNNQNLWLDFFITSKLWWK